MVAVQLSFEEALRRQELALDGLEEKYPDFLARARHVAVVIAEKEGEVTADDIRAILAIPSDVHHNVMGVVFRGPGWWRVGRRQSGQPQGHGNWIGVWRLRDER